ncbi:MAG: PAS domain-containing protein, partial [Chitinophagaceae bacterium]
MTQKKIQEENSLYQAKLLKEVSDSIPGAIYQFKMDSQGHLSIPFISGGISRYFELSQEGLAKGMEEFLRLVHPEDLPDIRNRIQQSAQHLEPWHDHFRMKTRDGSYVWIRGHSIPTRMEEGSTLWNGTLIDVTRATESREALRRALEIYDLATQATQDVIWEYDHNSQCFQFAENFSQIFGYPTGDPAYPMDWFYQHIHPEDAERVKSGIASALFEKQPKWAFEYRFRCADGTYKFILNKAYTLFDKSGEPIRMIGAIQDISDRKLAEARILHQNEVLKDIAWVSSHE